MVDMKEYASGQNIVTKYRKAITTLCGTEDWK